MIHELDAFCDIELFECTPCCRVDDDDDAVGIAIVEFGCADVGVEFVEQFRFDAFDVPALTVPDNQNCNQHENVRMREREKKRKKKKKSLNENEENNNEE